MKRRLLCGACGRALDADGEYCPHCGTVIKRDRPAQCEIHPEKRGASRCILCGTVMCEVCAKRTSGRYVCARHKRVTIVQDWATVFESPDVAEADLIRSVLHAEGLNVLGQNFQSIGYLWEGGGDSLLSRLAINRPAKVFVPIPEYARAIQVIQEWQTGTRDDSGNESSTDD